MYLIASSSVLAFFKSSKVGFVTLRKLPTSRIRDISFSKCVESHPVSCNNLKSLKVGTIFDDNNNSK